ncbi:MAG: hypothetical protein AVDCRST_MAG02-4625 [uncultured Rubrobacteraceae bacterium]|uniref:Uncharacterized protein n=1 Tax=uncultured Rubrobacteraceae bacterium TaxID=349277 RepID=A0A6J4RX17_9ACTN|nr:MAG: hypothetical protein AVDCRST_MAG02-4625 [uncultured Rubrobacteraceae bacterium]
MPPEGRTTTGRDAAEDYRRKTEQEISTLSRRMKEAGHPAPLGDPTTGVVLVVEQPVGPRVLDALQASLLAVGLPDAYVTYAATGLLGEEILATEPQLLVAVGPGAARDLDDLDYPLARRAFAEAEEGTPFTWTSGAAGLRLPPLAPALDHDESKRRFWRLFLVLRNFAP